MRKLKKHLLIPRSHLIKLIIEAMEYGFKTSSCGYNGEYPYEDEDLGDCFTYESLEDVRAALELVHTYIEKTRTH